MLKCTFWLLKWFPIILSLIKGLIKKKCQSVDQVPSVWTICWWATVFKKKLSLLVWSVFAFYMSQQCNGHNKDKKQNIPVSSNINVQSFVKLSLTNLEELWLNFSNKKIMFRRNKMHWELFYCYIRLLRTDWLNTC